MDIRTDCNQGFSFKKKKKLFSPKGSQSSAPTFSLIQSTVAALQPGFFSVTFFYASQWLSKENGRAKARELYFPAILSMLYVVLTF